MRQSKFTESQRMAILAKQDAGQRVEEICREHQISPATFYKWKKEEAIEQDEDKHRLKQLEEENARLKKIHAELSLPATAFSAGTSLVLCPFSLTLGKQNRRANRCRFFHKLNHN